jgi:hypothetical protein
VNLERNSLYIHQGQEILSTDDAEETDIHTFYVQHNFPAKLTVSEIIKPTLSESLQLLH